MKKLILTILLLTTIVQITMSQTATGSFIQLPCNNDGIYSITTTGIPLPITYTYYLDGLTFVHSNVNSTSDQLTNIPMGIYGSVFCQVSGGGLNAFIQDNYTPSFTFSLSQISPICPATMGSIVATQISGTPGPFSFTWTNNQTLLTYSGNNASVPVGEYTGIIADQTTGCVLQVEDSALYVSQLSNVTGTVNVTPANCTNGTATVVPSGGNAPYTFQWSNGATTATITGLTQGYYPVTVLDVQGCQSNYLAAFIQQTPFISVPTTVTNATCVQANGSAIAFGSGGVNPYSYTWSNGQTGNSATGLSGPNMYTVIATDANGCIGQGNAYVNINTPINVTYTSTPSQCTSATGSATLSITGGTAPYSVTWYNNPSATGNTLTNVAPGSYSFEVTDAVGCIRTGVAVINPISTINANVSASTVICPNINGTAVATVTGSNGPFTYLWNTGGTTNQIGSLSPGWYSCIITDAVGCSVTKGANVSSASPLSVAMSATNASCLFSLDGSATAAVTGGLAPYTYSYSSGASTPTANALGVGNYTVSVTDANGCTKNKYFQIGNSNTNSNCYCTISGKVYVDANSDCIFNAGENGVENIMIHCSGFGYTFTDANGNYSFQVPSGSYTISEQVNAYYPLASCQSNAIPVSVVAAAGCNNVVDFANNMITIHDLKISTVSTFQSPIPGNIYQQKVIVKNQGTITESGVQLGYNHDSQIPFLSATLPSFVQLNSTSAPYSYSVQTGFPTLSPNTTSVINLSYNTPTNIPLGTVLNFYDTATHLAPINVNWLLDYTPWNNVNTYQPTVIGSYDPNFKEVSPKGTGVEGFIPMSTTELDYTIHFQNEGSYFAQNIVVTDQLDADLDWTTLKPGYSQYDYTTTVSETGLVTFRFENIYLPWKDQYGDALSSALINYSISRKTTNPEGTEFTNKADIYFDYNAPIETNTTINTLFDPFAGTEENTLASTDVSMDLYPVPAKENLTIRVNNMMHNEKASFAIFDLMGNMVLSQNLDLNLGSTLITHDVSDLATGTYLTRIQFADGSFLVKKIVISKN